MSIINEDALAVMIAAAVKEQRPRLEEDLTGRAVAWCALDHGKV